MHQTFYIDIDEEITSIIERMRKAKAEEIVIVVPKNALLIQSIINLKLLKREADKMDKNLIVVTQDKVGKLLVEKAGISAQQRLEDVEGIESGDAPAVQVMEEKVQEKEAIEVAPVKSSKKRLDKIGSADFFEENEKMDGDKKIALQTVIQKDEVRLEDKKDEENEKILNKELVIDLAKDIKKERNASKGSMDMIKNVNKKPKQKKETIKENEAAESTRAFFQEAESCPINRIENYPDRYAFKEEKVDQFLSKTEGFAFGSKNSFDDSAKSPRISKEINLPSKFWKFFLILGSLVVIFALGLFLYLFLPKAKVTISVKTSSQSVDAEIKGNIKNASVDVDGKAIPAKLISFADEISIKAKATGEKTSSSQKARGIITIYNEYNSSPQPLVATTRFLSPEGKLFRLVAGVTVPGMTNVGGEVKPGAVEAEVVADEPGESFNIGATTFTIPGFKDSGNDKYSKFYAKSFKSMAGGGSGNETAKNISEQDIDSAKNNILSEFNSSVKQKIKDRSGEGQVILDDATVISEINYSISNSTGDVVNEFTVTLKAKTEAIVFSESDAKNVIEKIMEKSISDGLGISEKTLALEFGKVDVDLLGGNILIRVHGTGKTDSGIDQSNLKKGILGKTNEELEAYLKSYSKFSNIEVEYWPAFMSKKIPIYESRVEVVLDNN